jgi:hypothetical protein
MTQTVTVGLPTGIPAVDTANITAAINALPPSGGLLIFEAGTYLIDSTITLPAQALVQGAAPAVLPDEFTSDGTTLLPIADFTWCGGRMVDATAAVDLQLRNLVIGPLGGTVADAGVANPCCLAVANNVYLSNVLVRNVHSAGPNPIWGVRQIGGGVWVTADHLLVTNCDGGARLDNPAFLTWKQCYVGNSSATHNLEIVQTPPNANSMVTFHQCLIDETAGIVSALISDCQDVSFVSCLFYANGAPALYDQGTRTKVTNSKLLAFGDAHHVTPYTADGSVDSVLQSCYLQSSPGRPAVFLVNNGNVTLQHCTVAMQPGGTAAAGTGLAVFRNCPGINPRGELGPDTPAVPASGTPVTNDTGFDVVVYLSGGAAAPSAAAGADTGLTAGSFRLPARQTITVTYTVAPTWRWIGD